MVTTSHDVPLALSQVTTDLLVTPFGSIYRFVQK